MTSPMLGSLAVVGSINVDLTASVDRLPGAGETVLGGTLRRLPGGKGANQAVAAARLGGRVRMIGAVGDDADGQWMLQSLRDSGVDTGGVWLGDAATGTALITVDGAGENQIVVCPGANEDVSIDGVEFGAEEAVLAQLEIPLEVIESLGVAVPGFLAINAAPARSLTDALVRRADLIIVNETEFELQPELAGARLVAVTYGADGAALRENGREVARVAAPRVSGRQLGGCRRRVLRRHHPRPLGRMVAPRRAERGVRGRRGCRHPRRRAAAAARPGEVPTRRERPLMNRMPDEDERARIAHVLVALRSVGSVVA